MVITCYAVIYPVLLRTPCWLFLLLASEVGVFIFLSCLSHLVFSRQVESSAVFPVACSGLYELFRGTLKSPLGAPSLLVGINIIRSLTCCCLLRWPPIDLSCSWWYDPASIQASAQPQWKLPWVQSQRPCISNVNGKVCDSESFAVITTFISSFQEHFLGCHTWVVSFDWFTMNEVLKFSIWNLLYSISNTRH